MKFQRFAGNPIIPRTGGTFYSVHSANPDILLFRDRYFFYFRGQGKDGHDQIGVAYASPQDFDGIHWRMYPGNPIIPVSQDPSDFDSGYILDPAAIELYGIVYLFFTAHRIDWKDWDIPSYIGLAISEDGIRFEKHAGNPIIVGTEPEVVLHEGRIYLFFQRKTADGYFQIYYSQSDDGIHFSEEPPHLVFGPSKQSGTFDQFSISTIRIWAEGDLFYMAYGGCDRYFDYPGAIGLARSHDLRNWERYPGNPILERGLPGSWDEGALWFATILKVGHTYYLCYEGTGTGLGSETPEARKASRLCREEDYGGYAKTSFSQIGLATYEGRVPEW